MLRAALSATFLMLLAPACTAPSAAGPKTPLPKNGITMASDTSAKKSAKIVCAMEHDTGSNIPVRVCRRVDDPDTEGAARVQDKVRDLGKEIPKPNTK